MAIAEAWSGLVGNVPQIEAGILLMSQDQAGDVSSHVVADLYFRTPNRYSYNGLPFAWAAFTREGGQFASGSGSFNATGSNFTMRIGTAAFDVPTTWRPQLDFEVRLTIQNRVGGGTAEVWLDGWIPFRPPQRPDPATAVMDGETRAHLSWHDNQHLSMRISEIQIERYRYGIGMISLASIDGSATDYWDNGLGNGQGLQYRVRACGEWPQQCSDWVSTNWIDTRPQPVSNVAAAKASNGIDIVVSWTNPVGWFSGRQSGDTRIYDLGSGTRTLIATLTANASSWTHPAPSSATPHRYAVVHVAGGLESSDALSGTVTLIAPPLAPTNVRPVALDPATVPAVPVTWTHNPVDTTVQQAYSLRHRLAGTSVWTTVAKVASGVSSWTPTWSYVRGQSIEVQVRTWGAASDGSPWSDTQLIVMDGIPTVTITSPGGAVAEIDSITITSPCTSSGNVTVTLGGTSRQVAILVSDTPAIVAGKLAASPPTGWAASAAGAVVTYTAMTTGPRTAPAYSAGSTGAAGTATRVVTGGDGQVTGARARLEWLFNDPEGTAQSAAIARLIDSTDAVLETVNISGSASFVDFATVLQDIASYAVTVTARDGAGQWSTVVSRQFGVDYADPALPTITTTWDEERGRLAFTLTGVAPAAGQVAADLIEIRRGGVTVDTYPAPAVGQQVVVMDPIPPTDGDVVAYEVISWQMSTGAQATLQLAVTVPWMVQRAVWLNAGPAWTVLAAAAYGLTVSEDVERAVQASEFAGRMRPVMTYGQAVTESIKISGKLPPEADHLAFGAVQQAGTVVCLRWPEGRRWVMLSGPSLSTAGRPSGHTITLSATVIDHSE